ncbi:hypothetical protein LVD15_07635 [Fulvivirga maritima]|uniref:hypothetical protein n=1 Tax=Fulvivirga maritima TaxID=2904247 RepID=UPI001F483B11|nr:hypothetical protein [Fulvivirga maritima]UII28288.1 hypothetical protein LVD15_07635 [Fulvivirga maritima]
MLLFFIEQDSETPIPQIDAILRIHHTDLIDAFNRHSYTDIETYLGDEDLLSYKLIKDVNFSKPIQFSFSGRYKMDKYEYSIHIQKLKSTHNFK